MKTWTLVTVYDANPNESGPSAWPSTFAAVVENGRISANCKARVLQAARDCGEYDEGDKLWLIAREPSGCNVAEETVTVS